MNEEFELITVTISLAATAMNQNNCRTDTGEPAFSAVMQSMSRHVILPSAFGKEARNKSHNGSWEDIIPRRALKHLWNKISSGLFHFCPRLRAKVPLPPWTWWAGVFRGFVISLSPQTKSVPVLATKAVAPPLLLGRLPQDTHPAIWFHARRLDQRVVWAPVLR